MNEQDLINAGFHTESNVISRSSRVYIKEWALDIAHIFVRLVYECVCSSAPITVKR